MKSSWKVRRGGSSGRAFGFTLIELMITVAIVAILAAIAYPSYTAYVVRSNRAAAAGFMLEVSTLQQRYLLDNRSYASGLATFNNLTAPSNVSSNYSVDTQPKPGSTGFTVTAQPINSQLLRDGACGTLTIDETGLKTASGSQGVPGCW